MARTFVTAIVANVAKVTATIAEEHTSVLQALHARGIRLGETIDHRHSHTQIFLEESLHRVINNQSRVEDLPDETARSRILIMAEVVQTEALSLKTSAQDRITAAEARLAQCNADADLDKCCTTNKSAVADKRQAHRDCRTEQASSKSTMETSCGHASTLADAAFTALNGHCSNEITDMNLISGYMAIVSDHKRALDVAIEACEYDSDANTRKVKECNSKQVAFEIAFCQLKTELENECTTLAMCYSNAKSAADDEYKSTKTDEQHFKSLWTVGATIRCLIDLVSRAVGTYAERVNITNVQVAACGDQTPPDNLTVDYQNLTKELCNAADEDLFPDETDFHATEYTNSSHLYLPDVDTSKCSGGSDSTSTLPSSTTPTSTPTTPSTSTATTTPTTFSTSTATTTPTTSSTSTATTTSAAGAGCRIKIQGVCKKYPKVNDAGWFDDESRGGPTPSTREACEMRAASWKRGCGDGFKTWSFTSTTSTSTNSSVVE